ncbi:hypothetical protein [Thermococcus sp.]
MRKRNLVLLLVLVLLFSVVATGCIGGSGSATGTSESQSSESSGNQGTSYSSSPQNGGGSTTETGTATWQTPWEAYNPVKLGGKNYYITHVRYLYTAGYNDGPKYTFDVMKERGYAQIHVYASEGGAKKDLGTFKVFAYHGKLTPVNNDTLPGLEYWIFVKDRTKDTDASFLAPILNFGALISGNTVEVEIVSGSERYFWSNPAALGMYSEMPYQEGDLNDVLSSIDEGIGTIWTAVVSSGIWTGLENYDLTEPGQYDWNGMGISYHYKISPDRTVTFDGKTFKTANVEWSYSLGGVSVSGKGKVAPALPIPVHFEGIFVNPVQGLKTWSEFELKDVKLSESLGALTYSGLTPTQTQTETQTQTQTETPGSGSNNWQLGWDASEPITINGKQYVVKEVTFRVEYKKGDNVFHMNITKGYREAELNGERAYLLYANISVDGEEYTYRVYVRQDYLNEYTSGILWVPQVYDMINGPDFIKIEITGPGCRYTTDENGNMEGDYNCGYISDDFQDYNMVWSLHTGFYGGIYGDVVSYVTLTNNGQGYTVEKDGKVSLAGIEFDLYKVTWSGLIENVDVPANGVTYVAPQLPFPVKVEAAISEMGAGGCYTKITLVGLRLDPTS